MKRGDRVQMGYAEGIVIGMGSCCTRNSLRGGGVICRIAVKGQHRNRISAVLTEARVCFCPECLEGF